MREVGGAQIHAHLKFASETAKPVLSVLVGPSLWPGYASIVDQILIRFSKLYKHCGYICYPSSMQSAIIVAPHV